MSESKNESDNLEKNESNSELKNESVIVPIIPKNTIKLNEREILMNQCNAILAENNWNESDIPMTSDYWSFRNRLRGMK